MKNTMAITFTSKTSKIVYIITAALTLLLLALKYFDDDKTNDPKPQDIAEAGSNLCQGATGTVVTSGTVTSSATTN